MHLCTCSCTLYTQVPVPSPGSIHGRYHPDTPIAPAWQKPLSPNTHAAGPDRLLAQPTQARQKPGAHPPASPPAPRPASLGPPRPPPPRRRHRSSRPRLPGPRPCRPRPGRAHALHAHDPNGGTRVRAPRRAPPAWARLLPASPPRPAHSACCCPRCWHSPVSPARRRPLSHVLAAAAAPLGSPTQMSHETHGSVPPSPTQIRCHLGRGSPGRTRPVRYHLCHYRRHVTRGSDCRCFPGPDFQAGEVVFRGC